MRLSFLAASALAAVLADVSPAIAEVTEIPGSQFEAGNWLGGAYTDAAGAFSYCYTTVSYQNGQVLWVGLYPNDTLSILLSQPDVKFEPGQKFELWVMMETGIPAIGNGEAWDADYAGITYDGIQASVDFLNSGRYLRMLGMGIDDGFDVDGIGPALVQAQDCLARQSGAGGVGCLAMILRRNLRPRCRTCPSRRQAAWGQAAALARGPAGRLARLHPSRNLDLFARRQAQDQIS